MGNKILIKDIDKKHSLYKKALEEREKLIENLGEFDDQIAVFLCMF